MYCRPIYSYNSMNAVTRMRIVDPLNQRGWVTSITAKDELPFNPKPPEFQQHLEYNAAGLIKGQCWLRSGVLAGETYIYDELQRLKSYTGSNGTNAYDYDLVGNRLSDLTGGTARVYAHGGAAVQPNALVTVTGATHNAQFTYDAHGALTLRSDWRYRFGPMKGGGRVITRPDNTKHFVVTDHLGSVRLTYDAQGGVLETADYEPFGALATKTGEEARTGYIGRETDNESSLGFNGVRLYDQQYGRFLSTDAMWEKFHATQAYHYSVNSPVQLKDDDGESPTMLVGAQIGASVDLFVQTVIEGKSMSGDNGNTVDWGRVGIAGLTGALTGGVSSMTTSVIGQAGLVGAASTVGGWAQRSHAHEKTTAKDVVVDASVGAVTSLISSGLSAITKQTTDGLVLKNELRRATNILENGRVRTGYVNHVDSLNEKYNNLGKGPANSFLVELMGGIGSSKPSKPAKTNTSSSGSKGGVPALLERPI